MTQEEIKKMAIEYVKKQPRHPSSDNAVADLLADFGQKVALAQDEALIRRQLEYELHRIRRPEPEPFRFAEGQTVRHLHMPVYMRVFSQTRFEDANGNDVRKYCCQVGRYRCEDGQMISVFDHFYEQQLTEATQELQKP